MAASFNKQVIMGALIGITIGVALNFAGPSFILYSPVNYLCEIIGKGFFINLLKMMIIPLIFTSIVVGIANLRAHAQMDRVWKWTMVYFFTSSGLAIILGLIVVNVFKPGAGIEIGLFQDSMQQVNIQRMGFAEYVKKFIFDLFSNPVAAMANGQILPTIIFAAFVGAALVVLGDKKASTVLKFFNEFFEVIMIILGWIMRLLPVGLAALFINLFAQQDLSVLLSLAHFMILVTGATLFHGIVVLPALLFFVTKVTPLVFFRGVQDALILAFSSSSSSATLPVTMRCVEKNLKVDKNITGFVVPLGATVNMDGTALYEAMAALFVANMVGVELTFIQQLVVFITAMVASIGAPGIPSAGMVTMMMVLQSVGLPPEAVAILIPIDRPLDAIRTMVNVEGDCVGSMVVQKLVMNKP